ncbi:MAG: UPF0179 family protein [Thermoplasmata archaeon]|nr:UPF0179 family protein [Thermoplasmata archaeon]
MTEEKIRITVISKRNAVEGYRFVYLGPLSECKSCKVKGICFGLDPGQMYEIVEVRDRTHQCSVFQDGVRVVEVKAVPFEAAVDSKAGVEGAVITLSKIKCSHPGCPHYQICHPFGLTGKEKIKIVSVEDDLECPQGHSLKKVKAVLGS